MLYPPARKLGRFDAIVSEFKGYIQELYDIPVFMTIGVHEFTLDVQSITRLIEAAYAIKFEDIISKSRERTLVSARHSYCYLLRTELGMTLGQIGKSIDRDHTTVISAVNSIAQMLEVNDTTGLIHLPKILEQIEELKKQTRYEEI